VLGNHNRIICGIVAMVCAPLVSCTSAYTNSQKGIAYYGSVGGDAKGLAMTAEGMTAESLETSKSFSDLSKTVRTGIYMGAARAITNSLAGAYKSVTNAKTAAGTAQAQAAEATKQTAIQAQAATEQAALLAVPPVAP
jgi:hypothetical protein